MAIESYYSELISFALGSQSTSLESYPNNHIQTSGLEAKSSPWASTFTRNVLDELLIELLNLA